MNAATARKGAAKTAERKFEREPFKMVRRVGSTTFKINVFTGPNATESAEQKLFRLIESEVRKNA
jgi:hypothetical protein